MASANDSHRQIALEPPPNGEYAIEVRDLRVYYGDFLAVKDVDLQVERQKITAIIGPSGCGRALCCAPSTG